MMVGWSHSEGRCIGQSPRIIAGKGKIRQWLSARNRKHAHSRNIKLLHLELAVGTPREVTYEIPRGKGRRGVLLAPPHQGALLTPCHHGAQTTDKPRQE